MIHRVEFFDRGLDQRVSPERANGGFEKLANVRISKRGEAGFATRIPGIAGIQSGSLEYVQPIAMVRFQNVIAILDRVSFGNFRFLVVDPITPGTPIFDASYSAEDTNEAVLSVIENTIFLAPHDYQVNFIDGTYRLQSFTSTTPKVTVKSFLTGRRSVAETAFTGSFPSTPSTVVITVVTEAGGIYNTALLGFSATSLENFRDKIVEALYSQVFSVVVAPPSGGTFLENVTIERGSHLVSGVERPTIKCVGIEPDPAVGASLFSVTINGGSSVVGYVLSSTVAGVLPDAGDSGDFKEGDAVSYRARYVMYDGHVTKTSYPVQHVVESNGAVFVTVDTIPDLDGTKSIIEIFRSKNAGPYQLVRRQIPSGSSITFKDEGRVGTTVLVDEAYVWPKKHKVQTFVRDRYLRANVTFEKSIYPDDLDVVFEQRSYVGSDLEIMVEEGDWVLPHKSELTIFGKYRLGDGSDTFHKQIGDPIVVNSEVPLLEYPWLKKLFGRIQDELPPLDSLDVKEIALYGKYRQLESRKSYKFFGQEFYNKNIPSIVSSANYSASHDYYDQADNKPLTPHIFLGWKHVTLRFNIAIPNDSQFRIYDSEFTSNGDLDNNDGTKDYFNFGVFESSTEAGLFNPALPSPYIHYYTVYNSGSGEYDKIWKRGANYDLILQTYRLVYSSPAHSGVQHFIYELAPLPALKRAAGDGNLTIRMDSAEVAVSSSENNDEISRKNVKIIGIVDTAEGYAPRFATHVIPPTRNHVYLVMERDSILDEIDNLSVNNPKTGSGYEIVSSWNGMGSPFFIPKIQWELSSFDIRAILTGTTDNTNPSYTKHNYITELYSSADVVDLENGLIQLGVFSNQPDEQFEWKQLRTGYELTKDSGWVSVKLMPDNIYDQFTDSSTVRSQRQQFQNQIWWSDAFLPGTNASRIRNFPFTNFKNMPVDHGAIVGAVPVDNRLLVFMERAVYMVGVGEVLTQQTDGGVRVDSSRILTNEVPLLQNLYRVHPESIVLGDNRVFFSDGIDVWMFTQGWENITSGRIDLSDAGDYTAFYDTIEREYYLFDGTSSFIYNVDNNIWTGPHSFDFRTGASFLNKTFVLASDARGLRKFDSSINTYDGLQYESIVESNPISAGDFMATKLWRKMYFDTQNAETVSYKNHSGQTYKTKNVADVDRYAGLFHHGIAEGYKNSIYFIFKFASKLKDFTLKLVDIEFQPRFRR